MLVQIEKENKNLFTGVTSVEAYKLLESSFEAKGNLIVGIGSCNENGLITGCLLCEITSEDTAEIRWIYVREPSRRAGYGREMVTTIADSLEKIGIKSLTMIYTEEMAYLDGPQPDDDSTILGIFAVKMGFEKSLMTKDLYTIGLSDLRDVCPKGIGKGMDIVAASTIPSHKILSYIKESAKEDNPALEIISLSSVDSFAPCSCACMEGSEIVALALFLEREDKNGVTLVYCDYKDINQAIAMTDRASKEALLLYKRTGIMSFTTLDGTGSRLISELNCPAVVTGVYEVKKQL